MARRKIRPRIQGFVHNPLLIVAAIVAVLLTGWNYYISASRDLDRPDDNILPGGNFDVFSADGVPDGWRLALHGEMRLSHSQIHGYVNGHALQVDVHKYVKGDTTLSSPYVQVAPNQNYFFKGFYRASTNVDLLAHYFYADGSDQLQFVQQFPANVSAWSTLSTAFNSEKRIRSVQFVYRLSGNGYAQFDSTYLVQKNDISLPAQSTGALNLLTNGDVNQVTDLGAPVAWSNYHAGKNHPSFSYQQAKKPYLHTEVNGYKNGEAKWQQAPVSVHAGQFFRFGVSYRSDARSDIVAEYLLQNGKREFDTLATLDPADSWTHIRTTFDVPSDAKTMSVTVVLHANGSLDTTNYQLQDGTKPGAVRWSRPLVSLTFDDGWSSAYQNAWPLLSSFGYKATFYLNPSTINTRNFMSILQLEKLQQQGNELASHSYTHLDLTTVNTKRLDSELRSARDYMQQTFGIKSLDFATPYGNTNAEVQNYVKHYYRSHRTTADGVNTKQNFDPYNLRVLYVTDTTPLPRIQDALYEAQTLHGWLIIVYHQIANKKLLDGKEGTNTTPAIFMQQLRAIHDTGVTVKPVDAALDEVEN